MIHKHLSRIRIISILTVLLLSNAIKSEPTKIQEVFAPSRLGNIQLLHDENGFLVFQDGVRHQVKKIWTDPILREITTTKLKKFLASGYIQVEKMSDNEFTLKAKGRLLGSGPIAASIAYWATKSLCYGTLAAAAGTVTVATGGAAGALVGAGMAAATTAVAGGVGATVAAGAIAGAGAAGGAAAATTSVVAAAGGVVGAMTAVETASLGAFAFFLALPIP